MDSNHDTPDAVAQYDPTDLERCPYVSLDADAEIVEVTLDAEPHLLDLDTAADLASQLALAAHIPRGNDR